MGAVKDAENGMEKHALGAMMGVMEHAASHVNQTHSNPWAAEKGALERHSPCPWAHAAHGARNHTHHGPCPWASEMGALDRATAGARNHAQPNPMAAMLGAAKAAENGVITPESFHPFGAMGAMMGNHTHPIPWAVEMGAMEHASGMNKTAVAAIMETVKEGASDNPIDAKIAMMGNHTGHNPFAAMLGSMGHAANGTRVHTPHFPFAAGI